MGRPIKHGSKWRIRPLNENGKRISLTFDTFKEAEYALKKLEAEVHEIRCGFRAPRPLDKTCDELFDYWIKNKVPQKRSGDDDISVIRCHLRPAFGPLLLRNVGVEQVDEYQAKRLHLNKKTINNHLTLLISMLNLAVDLNWLTKRPRIKKPRVTKFSRDYRYLRSDDEIRRFLLAALEENEYVHAFYSVAVYTGMRAGEIAGLRKEDIDFSRRLITVQHSYSGPRKAENVCYVPILDPLLTILERWFIKTPGPLVFPNIAGNMHGESARIFQETLHRVLDRAGFPMSEQNGKLRRYIRFHDLRHTFASHWVMKGGDVFKLQKILGHQSIQMTMRYAHLAPEAFASDYGIFGQSAPGMRNATVIPLSKS